MIGQLCFCVIWKISGNINYFIKKMDNDQTMTRTQKSKIKKALKLRSFGLLYVRGLRDLNSREFEKQRQAMSSKALFCAVLCVLTSNNVQLFIVQFIGFLALIMTK